MKSWNIEWKNKKVKNSRYITGFDGLRSLAVVGVIFYHLLPTSMKGGYLGVPIFFRRIWLFDHGSAAAGMGTKWKNQYLAILCQKNEETLSGTCFYACDSFGLYHFVSARAVKQSSRSCGQQLTVCQQLVANQ